MSVAFVLQIYIQHPQPIELMNFNLVVSAIDLGTKINKKKFWFVCIEKLSLKFYFIYLLLTNRLNFCGS